MSLPPPVKGLEPGDGPLIDPYARVHTYLRVSVTDRCNYRCTYCLPAGGIDWLPRERLLRLEEIARVVRVFAQMGVRQVRLTGGEPTIRRNLTHLIRLIAQTPGIDDVAMTTNGHAFASKAHEMAAAGLNRVNISLDTLDPALFAKVTRGGDLSRVLAAIEAAREAGLGPIKINTVVVRGLNDDQLVNLVEGFSDRPDIVVRFIEYMPFSGNEPERRHVPMAEVINRLSEVYTLEPIQRQIGLGPAKNWRIGETGQVLGFISPITSHFCDSCNRLRLQADGHLRTCLSKDDTPSLRALLREGADDETLASAIRTMVWGKVAGHEAHKLEDWRTFEGVMTRIGG